MKLDRNTTPDKVGKYSLILNRRVAEIIESGSPIEKTWLEEAFAYLRQLGVLDDGNDSSTPAKQFFVMRYGDRLTHWALWNYGSNALSESRVLKNRAGEVQDDEQKRQDLLMQAAELEEFAFEIHAECKKIEALQSSKDHSMKYPTE